MDMTKANAFGFLPAISIEDGIKETIEWYIKNGETAYPRYNAFTEKVYLPV